eukprot:179130-Chlamydomonas_euryale.AAC.6
MSDCLGRLEYPESDARMCLGWKVWPDPPSLNTLRSFPHLPDPAAHGAFGPSGPHLVPGRAHPSRL